MLEKEEKYKDLHQKLQRLNLHNLNLIQSMSTIKITLLELVHDFINPTETSFITKIQQIFITMFSNLDKVCSNLQKTIETKISNYQTHIENLNRQYKEILDQVTHYRRKVESIKKGPLEEREEKQRLDRNIEKKKQIDKKFQKTESLLIENYENFHKETQDYLKIVPNEILMSLIEGNLQTASKIIETVEGQTPAVRKRLRRESIISQISDADALSEYSEEDLCNSNEINIIIEPQSDEILNEDIERIQLAKNEDTIDEQNHSKQGTSNKFKSSNKSIRKSLMRRSSIEDQLKNKAQLLQNVKKLLEFQTSTHSNQTKNQLLLEKTFETVEAPLTHAQKIKRIFDSTKNKFCDFHEKQPKTQLNFEEKAIVKPFHQKSFVLQKQQCKHKRSLKNLQKPEIRQRQHSKNQETLNCPSDEQNFSNGSPHNDNNVSISSELSRRNQTSIFQKSAQLGGEKYISNSNIDSLNKPQKEMSFKTEEKSSSHISPEKIKNNPITQLKHHATFNYLPKYPLGSIQEFRMPQDSLKPSQFGQTRKKKIIEQLFSGPNQKINENKPLKEKSSENKKIAFQTHNEQKPQTDLKYWFSTAFSSQKQQNLQGSRKVSQTNHAHNLKINDQKSHPYTTQNLKTVPTNKQIDFSIFEKIV